MKLRDHLKEFKDSDKICIILVDDNNWCINEKLGTKKVFIKNKTYLNNEVIMVDYSRITFYIKLLRTM